MKKCRILLVFVWLPVLLNAQVSLDESALPQVNDVIKTLVDNMPSVNLKKQGQDQYWDFSSLTSGLAYQSTLAESDSDMLKADFEFDYLIKDASGWIRFYHQIGNRVYEVAIQRPHPLNSAITVLSRYSTPKLIVYAPMRYKNDLTNRSEISFMLSGREIPALVNKRLPVTADSIRIIFKETRDFRVDAWGTLSLSYDRFEVIRQEISSLINTTVEIYTAGRWSKINNNVLDPNGDLLGVSKERFFIFYSDEVKEPIAKIKMSPSGDPEYAEIRAPDGVNDFVTDHPQQKLLVLSPNPTYGDIKLELMNLDYGTYKFEVFNILSKKLWGEEIKIDRKLNSFRYNFSFLGKGTYLWAITDSKGGRITTKRLVIITP